MTGTAAVLVGLWAATLLVVVLRPGRGRLGRIDVWAQLPLPAVLLDHSGRVTAASPLAEDPAALVPAGPLPGPGASVTATSTAGRPLALTGLRGGALAVALPEPGAPAGIRDGLLAELAPRLAHELNTPLAAVAGHLSLVAPEVTSAAGRASLRTAGAEVARLGELCRDLLTLTGVRAGAGTVQRVRAGSLAEEAVAALLPMADAAGVTLSVRTPPVAVWVTGVPGDLIRALTNLIANALTHGSPPGATVEVSVTAEAGAVLIAVSQDGPGIDAAELAGLCAPLRRGPHARGVGSGLGLAIVSEVLAAAGTSLVSGRAGSGPDARAWLGFRLPRG